VKEAPSDRPIAGRETATILESSIINEETRDAVRSSHDLEAISSCDLLATFGIATSLPVASQRVVLFTSSFTELPLVGLLSEAHVESG
jgi:hypothetical protein